MVDEKLSRKAQIRRPRLSPDVGKSDDGPEKTAQSMIMLLQQVAGNQATNDLMTSGGRSLPQSIQTSASEQFGVDLDEVRVHTDEDADRRTAAAGASAMTVGTDVYFAPGVYRPDTEEGTFALRHELAHVVQQTENKDEPTLTAQAAELAADEAATSTTGSTVAGQVAPGTAQLLPEDEKLSRSRPSRFTTEEIQESIAADTSIEPSPRAESEVREEQLETRSSPGGKSQPVPLEGGIFAHKYAEPLREVLPPPEIPKRFAADVEAGNIIPLVDLPGGLLAEQAIGTLFRADRVTVYDAENGIIYEIKPDTVASIRNGQNQVLRSVELANQSARDGRRDWRGIVVVYNRKAARKFVAPPSGTPTRPSRGPRGVGGASGKKVPASPSSEAPAEQVPSSGQSGAGAETSSLDTGHYGVRPPNESLPEKPVLSARGVSSQPTHERPLSGPVAQESRPVPVTSVEGGIAPSVKGGGAPSEPLPPARRASTGVAKNYPGASAHDPTPGAAVEGVVIALQGANFVLNMLNDEIQAQRVRDALAAREPEIAQLRQQHPDSGVLIVVYFRQSHGLPDSPIQPGPIFERIELGIGRDPRAAQTALGGTPKLLASVPSYQSEYVTQQLWFDAINPQLPGPPTPPLPHVGLGTFTSSTPVLQDVEWANLGGFDDEGQSPLSIPDGVTPRFFILQIPSEIASFIDKPGDPTVKRQPVPTTFRGDFPVVSLDPSLPFSDVVAVAIFPADQATAELFAQAPSTRGLSTLLIYDFDLVRWARPDQIKRLASTASDRQGGQANPPDVSSPEKLVQ